VDVMVRVDIKGDAEKEDWCSNEATLQGIRSKRGRGRDISCREGYPGEESDLLRILDKKIESHGTLSRVKEGISE
jgi:hypothetical protein